MLCLSEPIFLRKFIIINKLNIHAHDSQCLSSEIGIIKFNPTYYYFLIMIYPTNDFLESTIDILFNKFLIPDRTKKKLK